MRLLLQFHANLLKLERTRTFQQDGLVAELREGKMRQKVAHIGEEIALHVKFVGLARDAITDTDQHVNVFVLQQLGNLRVQVDLVASALQDVGQDDHTALVLVLLPHHVQSDGK